MATQYVSNMSLLTIFFVLSANLRSWVRIRRVPIEVCQHCQGTWLVNVLKPGYNGLLRGGIKRGKSEHAAKATHDETHSPTDPIRLIVSGNITPERNVRSLEGHCERNCAYTAIDVLDKYSSNQVDSGREPSNF